MKKMESLESAAAQQGEEKPAFHGRRMVGIAFLSNILASTITLATFGNFVDPVSEAFGTTRSTISQGMAIAFVVIGLTGPFSGVLLDRGWARSMMVVGSLMAGTGLIFLSQAQELWQAGLLFCGVVGLGAALFGIMPAMALVSHWFVKQRGLAIGISAAGLTIAGGVAPAAAEFLIELYGWRTALMIFGVGTIAIGVPVFGGLVIGRPESIGQRPDGESISFEDGERPDAGAESAVLDMGEIARDSRLWIVSIGFGLILTSPLVLSPIVVPYGTDLGLTAKQASAFFFAMMPFSLLGKVVIGRLADVAPIKPAMAVVVLGNSAVWLLFSLEPGFYLFLATGALYGIGIGGVSPLQGVTIGRIFGRENFGRASGLGGLVGIAVIASAMVLFQSLYGSTGDYQVGFFVQSALILLGGGLIALVRIPKAEGAGA